MLSFKILKKVSSKSTQPLLSKSSMIRLMNPDSSSLESSNNLL